MEAVVNSSVALAHSGSRIDEVFRSLRGKLLGFIRTRVGDEADAEDILQDVFYQFARSSELEEPIEQATSWLYTVAKNRIIP